MRAGRTSPISYVQLLLPSSLRIVLPIAFVYSTRPPVSVCGTVKIILLHESFLENRNFPLAFNNSNNHIDRFTSLYFLVA